MRLAERKEPRGAYLKSRDKCGGSERKCSKKGERKERDGEEGDSDGRKQ